MFHVYWRDTKGKLCKAEADPTDDPRMNDHSDAILLVKEMLVGAGEAYNDPVLCMIRGGKNVSK